MNKHDSNLPLALYTAEQVRELDRVCIEEAQIPGLELMTRAGKAAFECLCNTWPQAKRILVLCGRGNNAGDGYILARLAFEAGYQVEVVQMVELSVLKGDARQAAENCLASGLALRTSDALNLGTCDVVVDALIGTGLDRVVDSEWARTIQQVNDSYSPVFSLDIPSGLYADTGQVAGVAIKAAMTLTFIGLKQGLFTADGPHVCGHLRFASLDVANEIYAKVPSTVSRLERDTLSRLLAPRPATFHKGKAGHVLVIGGDYGYAGAIRLCAEAALRVGAGLVTVATRAEHALSMSASRPELMTCAVESGQDIGSLLSKVSVVAIGPGLGQSSWARALLGKILESSLPLLLDADALNLLALEPTQNPRWVLTPHPGEAARLLDKTVPEVQQNRFESVKELQQRYGGVCVLKGNGSLIIDQDQMIAVCQSGNPGMASGGMGDVLSGVISGLMAQGLSTNNAARLGVDLHGQAADIAAKAGERGTLASDLLPVLRQLVNPEPQ